MSTRQRKKSYIRPLVIPLIALGFTGYFAWHGWHGSFGIEARRQLDADFARLKEQHLAIVKERADLERKVSLLRAQSLESDMLDERAREILGFAQRDEIVVYRTATTASLPQTINKK